MPPRKSEKTEEKPKRKAGRPKKEKAAEPEETETVEIEETKGEIDVDTLKDKIVSELEEKLAKKLSKTMALHINTAIKKALSPPSVEKEVEPEESLKDKIAAALEEHKDDKTMYYNVSNNKLVARKGAAVAKYKFFEIEGLRIAGVAESAELVNAIKTLSTKKTKPEEANPKKEKPKKEEPVVESKKEKPKKEEPKKEEPIIPVVETEAEVTVTKNKGGLWTDTEGYVYSHSPESQVIGFVDPKNSSKFLPLTPEQRAKAQASGLPLAPDVVPEKPSDLDDGEEKPRLKDDDMEEALEDLDSYMSSEPQITSETFRKYYQVARHRAGGVALDDAAQLAKASGLNLELVEHIIVNYDVLVQRFKVEIADLAAKGEPRKVAPVDKKRILKS
jgi:hypothetical protein